MRQKFNVILLGEVWDLLDSIDEKSKEKIFYNIDKAKSETTRSLSAYIGMSVDPWSSYSGYNSVTVSDSFKVFTYVFDQSKNDNTARMVFDLGKSTAGFTVTELKLEEVVLQWPTSSETVENYKTTIYPNPATDKVYINNLDGFQEYSILNMQGEVVKSGSLNSNQNQINVESYSPGIIQKT